MMMVRYVFVHSLEIKGKTGNMKKINGSWTEVCCSLFPEEFFFPP